MNFFNIENLRADNPSKKGSFLILVFWNLGVIHRRNPRGSVYGVGAKSPMTTLSVTQDLRSSPKKVGRHSPRRQLEGAARRRRHTAEAHAGRLLRAAPGPRRDDTSKVAAGCTDGMGTGKLAGSSGGLGGCRCLSESIGNGLSLREFGLN
jgi:hypothetical protein